MKKIGRLLVLALVLFVPFMVSVNADEKEKINVYLFRGEGCPHCAEAEEFFKSLESDEEYSKYYDLVKYEVWYDENNAKLMNDVAKKLDTEANGVPFIVIGEKYFAGYATSMDGEIKEAIKSAYESDSYKDVVKSLGKVTKEKKEEKSSPLVPIVIVSVVAIATVLVMVFITKEK